MYKKVAEKLYENFVVNTSVAAIQQEKSKYFTVKSPITVSLISKSKHLHILFLGFLIHPYFDFYNQNQSKSTSTYFGLFAADMFLSNVLLATFLQLMIL